MSMKFIRDRYMVPAKRGGRVRYKGARLGTIKSASHGYLNILLDGDKRAMPFHPTWKLEYLASGEQP